jgi:hypothetical protein
MRYALIALLLTACSSLEPTKAEGKHITAGLMTGMVVYGATESPGWACAAGTGAGIAKELYDATGRGHATARDVAYTAIPNCIIWYSIDWWRNR